MADNLPDLTEPLKESMARALQAPTKIDADVYHMMDKRDEALISDEILHGAMSKIFVYNFDINGTKVDGVSVKGAQHLARFYGGLKHRIVATTDKRGRIFTFKSYPAENIPMQVSCSIVPELENDPDYYEAVVEITDIKTGNTVQMSRLEKRFEQRRDKTMYERPNYTVIAESKARRNAILALVPQDVQLQFKEECKKRGEVLSVSAIDEKRDGVMKFAAAKALQITREQVQGLDWNQISGLSDAAKESIEAFTNSAAALGLLKTAIENKPEAGKKDSKPKVETKKPDAPKQSANQRIDQDTGEIIDNQPQNSVVGASGDLGFGE